MTAVSSAVPTSAPSRTFLNLPSRRLSFSSPARYSVKAFLKMSLFTSVSARRSSEPSPVMKSMTPPLAAVFTALAAFGDEAAIFCMAVAAFVPASAVLPTVVMSLPPASQPVAKAEMDWAVLPALVSGSRKSGTRSMSVSSSMASPLPSLLSTKSAMSCPVWIMFSASLNAPPAAPFIVSRIVPRKPLSWFDSIGAAEGGCCGGFLGCCGVAAERLSHSCCESIICHFPILCRSRLGVLRQRLQGLLCLGFSF